tara:strand:+ start:5777 stop:6082 length:306 start_codon:yes stop_codon:yes gene_type:complete
MMVEYTNQKNNGEILQVEVKKAGVCYVPYYEEMRNRYTFKSPITNTVWVVTPAGWSRTYQTQWWNADFKIEGLNGICLGTYGHTLRGAVISALKSEQGVYL